MLASALVISVFGHGLWAVSLVYQVRELGGGMLELSLATTALAIGLLACVLVGGVVADRLPRRRILLTVEIADTVTVGAVALLALTGTVQLWHLVAATAGFIVAAASPRRLARPARRVPPRGRGGAVLPAAGAAGRPG